MLPRLIRLRDAPYYVGMDKNRFNKDVRPYLTEIPIGIQGIAFDRVDLDAWVDQYKKCNGRPGNTIGGIKPWDKRERQGCEIATESGILKNRYSDKRFVKALAQAALKKRN